jgi:DNA primase
MKPENIVAIEDAIKKSSDWAQVAIKENIDVQSKRLLEFTNEQVFVDFKRLKDSTNFFLTISVRESKAVSMNSFPMLWSAILDERGAERMLSVLTNLTSRRRRYLAFREEDARTEAQRREAEAKEKTRADTLLR